MWQTSDYLFAGGVEGGGASLTVDKIPPAPFKHNEGL